MMRKTKNPRRLDCLDKDTDNLRKPSQAQNVGAFYLPKSPIDYVAIQGLYLGKLNAVGHSPEEMKPVKNRGNTRPDPLHDTPLFNIHAPRQDRIMTLAEVSKYLRLSMSTVYRMANDGKLPVSKIGRRWRFRKSTIDQFLADSERSSVS